MESSLLNDGGGVMFEFTVIYKSDWGMTQTKIIIARTLNSCIKLFEKKYPTAGIQKIYYSNGRECGWASKELLNA
jgi:hypothetical protein